MAAPEFRAGSGAYEHQLNDGARRHVLWFRFAALGMCCCLGALSGGRAGWVIAGVAVALTAVQVAAGRRAPAARAAVDLSLAAFLGAAQLWLGPAATSDWLFASVAILSLTCHFEWPARPGVSWAIALTCAASFTAFHRLTGGPVPVVVLLRLSTQSLLAWFGLLLLRTAARRADREAERAARSRIEAAAGHIRRRAERDSLAVLHDTASTTFLAIATAGARQLGWVREQCRSDLRLLTRAHAAGAGVTDLAELLNGVRGHQGLEVRLLLAERIPIGGEAADAICRGVTEALTNVARHSGDRSPTVSATTVLGQIRVAVRDDGVGFVPAEVRPAGRGIRESVVRRADAAGVGVTVSSEPDRGTRVEWTCPAVPSRGPRTPGAGPADLVQMVRQGVLTVCLIVQFGLTAPTFLRDSARGLTTPTSIAVFACLVAVGAGCAVPTLRGRALPARAAWAGAAVLLACSLAVSVDLPTEVNVRGEHWAFGLVGWYSLVVLFDVVIGLRLLVLVLHAMIFAVPVLAGQAGVHASATMWVFIVSVTGLQAGVALATGAVRALAGRAWIHVRETGDVQLAQYSAGVALEEHRRRYAEIRLTTVPLLQELAGGRLDPATPLARDRCAVEAARLRRLMCAADTQDDTFHQEVRAIADDLERQGIPVQLSIKGPPVAIPLPVRGVLLEPVVAALTAARSTARLTVLREVGAVRASAVCTGVPEDWTPPVADPRVTMRSTKDRDTLWLETVWTAAT